MQENNYEITKVKMVKSFGISDNEFPIIGTNGLATCVGVLLYSKSTKKAIVAHFYDSFEYNKDMITSILELIDEQKMDSDFITYKVIPGYYPNHYNLKNDLENYFKSLPTMFIPFNDEEIPDNYFYIDTEICCHDFAFNSQTGKFITDKKLFEENLYYLDSGIPKGKN